MDFDYPYWSVEVWLSDEEQRIRYVYSVADMAREYFRKSHFPNKRLGVVDRGDSYIIAEETGNG